jgi:metallo-beta-lactamase family protein
VPNLTFLGAAQTVTGSKYLLEFGGTRLLVDSGLFQGLKALRERNWHPLPVPADSIHAVVLTHAHLDHCGYLPRLVAEGFRGRIFCTPGTSDLCRIVLPDAGHLQEEDAKHANRHGYSKHHPALPLYLEADAHRAISQLQPVGYERPVPVAPGIEVEFLNAGHLLGSSFVRMTGAGLPARGVLFGGDLGRYNRPVLPDPQPAPAADVLLVESTYGNRTHPPEDDGERLASIVRETAAKGGKVVIPAFAVGRVEEVLYWLNRLEEQGRIPILPVYVDSPMAAQALKYYQSRTPELDPGQQRPNGHQSDRAAHARELCRFCTGNFRVVASGRESKELVADRGSSIVISASGMATGGRVLFHLESVLPDPRHTVLFVGFQAEGTRGRLLVNGAPAVRIHGRAVPVAARIELIDSMSAHADVTEILRWLGTFSSPPAITYLVHGEPEPIAALRSAITARLGWKVHAPAYLETVAIPGEQAKIEG